MKDLTVITNVLLSDGIGRQGIGLINTLMDDLDINTIIHQPILFTGITDQKLLSVFRKPHELSKISFWTFILGLNDDWEAHHAKLDSPIKIAYSMIESSAIPALWTRILNKYYDMVVVPDPWLVPVYKNSGVTIPIFVLPLGIILDDEYFTYNHVKNDTLTFGMTGSFFNRKNHIKVMEAFHEAFKNKNVKLKLHGRGGSNKDQVLAAHKRLGSPKNIEIYSDRFTTREYTDFLKSIDCYVFVSKGEGYSITPREMLAMGKPVILSNNTAHTTICNSGLVTPIKCDYKVPAYYEIFNQTLGNYYDCSTSDVSRAMKDVFRNYDSHAKIASGGREWVKQFTWEGLKKRYLNLLKPTKIVLSDKNSITEHALEIQSVDLYNKFTEVFK